MHNFSIHCVCVSFILHYITTLLPNGVIFKYQEILIEKEKTKVTECDRSTAAQDTAAGSAERL